MQAEDKKIIFHTTLLGVGGSEPIEPKESIRAYRAYRVYRDFYR